MIPDQLEEVLINAMSWKAEQVENAVVDQPDPARERELRSQARFLREKVSQLKVERIPLKEDELTRDIVIRAVGEFVESNRHH